MTWGSGTPHGDRSPAQTRLRFGGEHPITGWPQGPPLEAPPISYAPPQNPRKHWPFEAQMERWFPFPDGERQRFMTAERRGRHGRQCPDPTSPRRHPVVPGSRGSKQEVSTRGRLAKAGADAGLHNRRRTGEVCRAIRPYGKKRSDIPRGEPALQWAPVEPGRAGLRRGDRRLGY